MIEAISRGGLWLNMRDVGAVDSRYRKLVDQMFEEIAAKVPSFEMPKGHQESILISSPDAQVYYHADLPGQGLVQIAGRKRVYVYPNTAPFITPQHLEDIALFDVEVDLPYKDWYDDHAKVLDIGPGQMLSWPMNAPHRVENLDTFSVSMTISYTNDDIRRAEIVNLANGMLRHRFGYTPKTRNLRGPSFFAKAVMQKLLRDGKWVKRERSARRPIDFPPRRRPARQDRRSAEGGMSADRPVMTVLTTSVGKPDARATARAAGFRVELMRDWKQAAARWNDISPSTPFQHPQWYDGVVRRLRRRRRRRAA